MRYVTVASRRHRDMPRVHVPENSEGLANILEASRARKRIKIRRAARLKNQVSVDPPLGVDAASVFPQIEAISCNAGKGLGIFPPQFWGHPHRYRQADNACARRRQKSPSSAQRESGVMVAVSQPHMSCPCLPRDDSRRHQDDHAMNTRHFATEQDASTNRLESLI
jgi:hypothetical protein